MKKTTYVIIGLLVLTALLPIIGLPAVMKHAVDKYGISESVDVDSVLHRSGVATELNTGDKTGISFICRTRNSFTRPFYADIVFVPGSDSSRIVMDNMWYGRSTVDPAGDTYLIASRPEGAAKYSDDNVIVRDGKRIKQNINYCFADNDDYVIATAFIGTDSKVKEVVANDVTLRIYGTPPADFRLNAGNTEFCGDYRATNPDKQ